MKMKSSSKIRLATAAVLIALASYMSGCSVVGFGAGMAIDHELGDKKVMNKWGCGKIKTGTEVKATLVDGSSVSGEFRGLEKKPAEEYNNEYAEFREANRNEVYLPAIGDTLQIKDWDGDEGLHEFFGFDYRYEKSGKSSKKGVHELYVNVLANSIDKKDEKNYPLKWLEELKDSEGNIVTGQELKSLSARANIALRSYMVLEIDSGFKDINIETINSLEVPRKKHARWVGLGLGLAVDACIVAVAIAFASWSGSGSWN
jgi:hypothetical protein